MVTITVAGPGTCIGLEMALIKKAFSDAGIPLQIVDEYPDPRELSAFDMEKHKEQIGDWPIKLVAKHCPWGG